MYNRSCFFIGINIPLSPKATTKKIIYEDLVLILNYYISYDYNNIPIKILKIKKFKWSKYESRVLNY